MEEYYSVSDVMKLLKRSRSCIYAYINGGLLKARKLTPDARNSKMLILKSDLDEFINNGVPAGYYQKLYPRPHRVKKNAK